MELTRQQAKNIIILLAEKFNTEVENESMPDWYSTTIDIEIIKRNKKPREIATKLWHVLHPAGYKKEYKQQVWKGLKNQNRNVYQEIIGEFDEKGLNHSCSKDIIDRLISFALQETIKPREEPLNRIKAYLGLEDKEFISQLQKKEQDRSKYFNSFCNTRWYGYYRTKDPDTRRISVAQCKIKVGEYGDVVFENPPIFENDHTGHIELRGRKEIEFILRSKEREDGGKTYLKFRIHDLPNTENKNKKIIIHGLYLRYAKEAPQGGAMILKSTRSSWEEMKTKIFKITDNTKGIPQLPYSASYPKLNDRIKRFLFEKRHNFIATSKLNLSSDEMFKRQIKLWDRKSSVHHRPVYDLFISTPLAKKIELNDLDGSYNKQSLKEIKNDVYEIEELLKIYLMPEFYTVKPENFVVMNPFKMMGYNSTNNERVKEASTNATSFNMNPYSGALEISNTLLYVMYYPNAEMLSSCLIEAGIAVSSGVCCLFIVDKKEDLVRFLSKKNMKKHYPVGIVENKIEGFKATMEDETLRNNLGNMLGETIEFRQDDDPIVEASKKRMQ